MNIFEEKGWNDENEVKKFQHDFVLHPHLLKQLFEHPGLFSTAWKKHCSSRLLCDEDLFLSCLYRLSRGASFEDLRSKFGGSASFHSTKFYKILEFNLCFFKSLIQLPSYEDAMKEVQILKTQEKCTDNYLIFTADGTIRPFRTKNSDFYTSHFFLMWVKKVG